MQTDREPTARLKQCIPPPPLHLHFLLGAQLRRAGIASLDLQSPLSFERGLTRQFDEIEADRHRPGAAREQPDSTGSGGTIGAQKTGSRENRFIGQVGDIFAGLKSGVSEELGDVEVVEESIVGFGVEGLRQESAKAERDRYEVEKAERGASLGDEVAERCKVEGESGGSGRWGWGWYRQFRLSKKLGAEDCSNA